MKTTLWNKDFILVLTGQIISLMGNAILRFAIPLYLLSETGSAALFGLVSACAFVPMIVLMPVGGILADRINKRNIMVILDFATALLIMLFAVLLGKVNLTVIICVVLLLLYSIHGTYQPAVQASIPLLIPKESIMRGNAMINLVSSLSQLLGPVLGGTLFAAFGIMPILYTSIACFLASAVMELFISIPFRKAEQRENIFRIGYNDLRSSLYFMTKQNPEFMRICFIIAGINMTLSACMTIGLPVILTQSLGFPAETASRLYGYAEGVLGAGSLSGGLLAGILAAKIKAKQSPVFLFLAAATLLPIAAATALPFSQMTSYYLILAATFFMMVTAAFFQIQMMSYLQLLTPTDMLGKVISCAMCIGMCASPVGQAVYGLLFERYGNASYLLFGATFLTVAFIALLSVKTFRTLQVSIDSVLRYNTHEVGT